MTAAVTDTELKYADKIAKLLVLSQSGGPEGELAYQQAGRLMVKYQVSEAMVAAARGLTVDELVQDEFRYTGIYRTGSQRLGAAVAQHFGLKVVMGRDSYSKPIHLPLYLAGFRSDVERARLLDTALQLQAVSAMRAWQKTVDFSWMDKGTAFRTRRDFTYGFARGVDTKLAVERRAAVAEAKEAEAERTGATATDAATSVDLVLVDRKSRVDDFFDEVWGGKTRNVSHRYSGGAYGGRDAGYSAGRNANTSTGGNSLAGSRGAIGR